MSVSVALGPAFDIEAFIVEYYTAWGGTDEELILSYYSDDVTVQIPNCLMQGKSALREQFVQPFITGFPGNRHFVKNIILGQGVSIVEFTFTANHTGPFAGHDATNARIELPGCGVYEFDPQKRQITAARIYFDPSTLLKQITDQQAENDLAAVVDVSQAIAGESAVEKLVDRLMRAAIEQGGAERAVLVAVRGEELRTSAEATVRGDEVTVQVRPHPAREAVALPDSLVRHSIRTGDAVVLDDATAENAFSADPYIAAHHVRSVVSLPLTNQGKLIGILYLENNLTPRVFTPGRLRVLKVLASQAAISLENTGLYRDLADREARIRRLWDSNILGICVWTLDGAIVSANDEFTRMLQYGHDDLVSGRVRWTDLTPAEWREQDERAVAELRETGTFQPVEKEYFRKDGSRVPVLIGGALFEGSGNEGVAYVLDLTERKRTESLLALEKRSLEMISSGSSLEEILNYLCLSIDALGSGSFSTIMTMNPEGDKLWCLAGPHFPQACLPAVRPWPVGPRQGCCGTAAHRKKRVIVTDVLTDPLWPDEYRSFAADNGIRAAWSEPLLTKDGEVLGTFAMYSAEPRPPTSAEVELIEGASHIALIALVQHRNQSALRKSEEALRASERSLRSTIDGIPGLVGILAPDGTVEAVNRQILDYCGQALDELRNWGTNGTVHPEDLPHVAEVFTNSIASGTPYQIEQRLRRFDGEYRWFDNRGIPIRDESGRIARWYVLLTDVEDRTRALARLQQTQSDFAHMNRVSVMGELAASLSHEITQPIASARNNARAALNFMSQQPPNLGEVKEALGCVVDDADRAGDIVDRIRDQIKRAPPRKDRFDLNASINEVLILAKSAAFRNGVSVQTRLSDELSPVRGDRVQLQQVILNLLLNAVEAMGGKGRISVTAKMTPTGMVQIDVADEGPGIEAEDVPKVFQPDFSRKKMKSGLGLAIVLRIVKDHGGTIRVEQNKPGGARFIIELPGVGKEPSTGSSVRSS